MLIQTEPCFVEVQVSDGRTVVVAEVTKTDSKKGRGIVGGPTAVVL